MADIAVLIKTLEREEALITCVRSVQWRLREQNLSHRIYLADDGEVSSRKRGLYRRLRESGHLVLELDKPTGASRARNTLADRLEDEAWVLRMDDDFELTTETDVTAMRRILEAVPDLGVVADLERQIGDGKGVFSGQISDAQGYFERRGETLIKHLRAPEAFEWNRVDSQRYVRCDVTRNLLLIRRDVLQDVRWEERLPFAGEHEDFMLQVAAAGWGVAFTPDSIHLHRGDLAARGRSGHQADRERQRRRALEVFEEKWGIRKRRVRRSWGGTLRAALVWAKQVGDGLVGAVTRLAGGGTDR